MNLAKANILVCNHQNSKKKHCIIYNTSVVDRHVSNRAMKLMDLNKYLLLKLILFACMHVRQLFSPQMLFK